LHNFRRTADHHHETIAKLVHFSRFWANKYPLGYRESPPSCRELFDQALLTPFFAVQVAEFGTLNKERARIGTKDSLLEMAIASF
jgi:hypothetical protein